MTTFQLPCGHTVHLRQELTWRDAKMLRRRLTEVHRFYLELWLTLAYMKTADDVIIEEMDEYERIVHKLDPDDLLQWHFAVCRAFPELELLSHV